MEATEDDLGVFTSYYFDVEPQPWQAYFYHQPQKRKLAVAGIRAGKTFGAALGFIHFAHTHPYSRLANASISADQAKVVFYNALSLVSMPRYSKFVKKVEKSPYPMIQLENGAEMWFRSTGYDASYWRGWEFDWINGDEFGYVSNKTTVTTLLGRLIGKNPMTGAHRSGIFTITTSPRGRHWLYQMWRLGDPNYPEYNPQRYLSLRVRTYDNPHISQDDVRALMAEYSDRQRRQELEGEFLDPEDAVFSYESVANMCEITRPEVAALVREIETLTEDPDHEGFIPKSLGGNDYLHYELSPELDHDYVIGWDLGTSATRAHGRNATVGFVLDITRRPWRVVGYRRETQATYPLIINWIQEWQQRYGNRGQSHAQTVIDSTGSGNVVEQILQEEHNMNVDGATFTTASKPDIINAGQVCLDRGWVVMPPIRQVIDEFSAYELRDKMIVQDCVMGLCVALHRARQRAGDHTSQSNEILPTRSGVRELLSSGDVGDLAAERYLERRMAARAIRNRRRRQ